MKYAFVQLFPALEVANPAARIGAGNADVFERPAQAAPSEDEIAQRGDAEADEAARVVTSAR